MHKLTYQITTLSPVVLSTNGGETHLVSTREFISGTTIMGMYVSRYIEKYISDNNAHKDETFYNWFLSGSICFGNAYIDSRDERGDIVRNIPIPLSVQHEKEKKEIVFDLLFHDPVNQTLPISGFGRIEGMGKPFLYKQAVKKSLNFHHQHDPNKGTVKEGIFFNYEAIEKDQTFTGDITGSEKELLAFREKFNDEEIFYIGRSRNTQYGKVKLKFLEELQECRFRDIDLKIPGGEVNLTLLSPLIIYNDYGLSTNDCKVLEDLLKKRISNSVHIKKTFIKSEDIENYVSVWRLRRPSETCFKAGSCFIIAGLQENDIPKLVEIMETGIGERRKEGFGKISFNLQHSNEVIPEISKEMIISPPDKIPFQTEKILISLIKDAFIKEVKLEAIRESGDFKGLQTKSLFARLQSILEIEIMNREKFRQTLEQDLRKSARDNLDKCNNGKQTLFDFIQTKSVLIKKILNQNANFRKELDRLISDDNVDIDFESHILSNKNFEEELFKIYFVTFFTTMRKRMKILKAEVRAK